ncbi:MAG: radical SAM protein [Endomicrobiales bacterium]
MIKEMLEQARQYESEQQYDLAVKVLEEACVLEPKNDEVHLLLGIYHHRAGRFEAALKELGLAHELNPSNTKVFLLFGNTCFSMGEHERAMAYFDEAIRSDSANKADALVERGRVFEYRKDYRQAAAEYERSLELRYDNDLALRLIQLQKYLGNWDRVISLIRANEEHIEKNDAYLKNIFLSEREVAEKKLVLDSKPRSFTVTLTNRCNLDCIMCEAKNIEWDMPERILDEIVGYFPYLEHVMWQGGEVFLLDRFTDLLREAKKFPQMKQVITSNGMALSAEVARELVEQPDLTLTLSIDAVEKGLFERIRKGASFERLLETVTMLNRLRKASRSPLKLNINVTVMKSNYRCLMDIIEFAGLHRFDYVFFTSVTGNEQNDENIFLSQDREALAYLSGTIGAVEQKAREYGITLHNWLPVRPAPLQAQAAPREVERGPEKQAPPAPHDEGLLCYAPWQRVYIDWKGNFFPDCMCLPEITAGNVKDAGLAELWNGEGMQEYRRRLLAGEYQGFCKPDCISRRIPPRYLKFNR